MLDSDRLLDRRRLKRQLIVWRTLAIIFVVFLVLVAIGRFGLGVGGSDGNYLAQLWISGMILDDSEREKLI